MQRLPAILCVFLLTTVSPRIQEREPRPAFGTGRLGGRIIAADNGRPIADAVVDLHRWSDESPPSRAVTDRAGRFLFERISAGRYGIIASKRGLYLETRHGQTHPGAAGQPLTIADGQTRDVEIRMPRPGVIAGRVLDDAGEPLVYAGISLVKEGPSGTEHVVMGFSNSTTNDRGEYRIFGLDPGTYVLYALARQEGRPERRYAPTYYPGVLDPSGATKLTVAAGQELTKVDLTVPHIVWVTVSGLANGPDGHPLPNGSIALYWTTPGGIGSIAAPGTIRDGAFVLRDVVPGRYILRARHSPLPESSPGSPPEDLSVAVPLTVREAGIDGIHLKLTRGATLRGRVVFDGSLPPPQPGLFKILVESGEPGRVLSAVPAADGTFALRGIESGARPITYQAPPGWTLRSLTLGGHAVADHSVEFRDETTSEVTLTFSNRKR